MVFVFHRLAYFTCIMLSSSSIHGVSKGRWSCHLLSQTPVFSNLVRNVGGLGTLDLMVGVWSESSLEWEFALPL